MIKDFQEKMKPIMRDNAKIDKKEIKNNLMHKRIKMKRIGITKGIQEAPNKNNQ